MTNLLLFLIYLAFIALGLPDSVLGAAWPSMYGEFAVPVSYAGIVSFLIAMGTVISSLLSDRLTRRFGAGAVTACSITLTTVALFGFASADSFPMLLLWTLPYGIGAGGVDAALNNYVALHYAARHMSWLHCMWGIGTIVGPYVVGFALSGGQGWNIGYITVGIGQGILALLLISSLPLWRKKSPAPAAQETSAVGKREKVLTLGQIVRIPGTKEVMVTFFCYCALEAIAMLWASSYMVLHCGMREDTAASLASLFFIGITVGRAVNGFLADRFRDTTLIRVGQGIIAIGIAVMMLPLGNAVTVGGLVLIGLGCAPIYPCIIHSTPAHFGADRSQALIGVQMASAYIGTALMPPLFGLIANHISVALLPIVLAIILVLMIIMHEAVGRKTAQKEKDGAGNACVPHQNT